MTNFLLIAAAISPALLLLFLLSFRPKNLTTWFAGRPLITVLIATLTGVGSALIALGAENLLTLRQWSIGNLGGLALFTLIVAGVSEEGAKYLCIRLYSWRSAAFRERYDGILYSAAVGLGFGAAENISYVLSGGWQTALIRALTAVPFHCFLGVILGYYLGQSKVKQLNEERWGYLHWQGLAWAIFAHGLYDFFAFQAGLLSEISLLVFLTGIASWGVYAVVKTRSQSPSWGGVEPSPPGPFTPPALKERNPILAGLLGLIPGFGQLYNEEGVKGFILLGTGIINLGMLGFVAWLLSDPLTVLMLMQQYAGVSLAVKPAQLIADLTASPILSILVGLNILFSLFSAWEAYRTARSQKFDYLEAPEKRPRFVQTFCTSYLGHILTLVLFILVPIMASGGASASKGKNSGQTKGQQASGQKANSPAPFSFDIVTNPGKIDGFDKKKEGKQQVAKEKQKKVVTQKIARVKPKQAKGIGAAKSVKQAKANPNQSKESQEAKGGARSYNEYLSYRLHNSTLNETYFDALPPGSYTVVEYTVDADGTIHDAHVIYESTTAPQEVAEMVVNTVNALNPALPIPGEAHTLKVTELFWNSSDDPTIGSPGTLEYKLSRLPDGRSITVMP
jgi:protease PrsW